MSPLKTIICLANSRKHGERCVAGIDVETGQWVRPVSGLDDGRVPRARQLVDGRDIKLLELVQIPLDETGPDFGFESENLSLLEGAWSVLGSVSPKEIIQYCSRSPSILHNDEHYVPLSAISSLPPAERQTLLLVETTEFRVVNKGPSMGGGHKWEGTILTTGGAKLTAKITDPIYVEKLESGHEPPNHCLLTISLGMPFRPPHWPEHNEPACWKLIAAIIELEERPAFPKLTVDAVSPVKPKPSEPPVPDVQAFDPARLHHSLKKIFGYDSFRSHQERIIRAIIDGRDAFVVMPTGSGKSLCYQLPAHLLKGCCVVVSPLISLMKDQVDAARENGLRAASINSSQSESERLTALRYLSRGELDLLYAAPERIATDSFLNNLKRSKLCLFAVDEAHCISEWGHDFRPDYLFLSNLREQFPHIPITAFTAAATEEVEEDTVRKLGLREPFRVRASFDRKNLFYHVTPKNDIDNQILDFICDHPGEAGIVYRTTRKSVDSTVEFLSSQRIRVLPYHAGLSDIERNKNQEAFNRDEIDIIVATIAFGMGIDKSNVRFVLHGDLPKNLENYYQETGRAGRDGLPAQCVLFFSRKDIPKVRFFIDQITDKNHRTIASQKLDAMVNYASVNRCRRKQLLAYFSEEYGPENCETCDICSSPSEEIDATADARLVVQTVFETGQRFGTGHTVDIISGANTKKIRNYGHNAFTTYGSGKDKSKDYWRQLVDELISRQFLTKAEGPYPILRASSQGLGIANGSQAFRIRLIASSETRPILREPTHYDKELFEKLRRLRKQIADDQNVPAYVVFHDRTLQEMSERKPLSLSEMRELHGVGEKKFVKYGEQFLGLIRQHCNKTLKDYSGRREESESSSLSGLKVAPDEKSFILSEDKAYSVEEIRKNRPRAYALWTEEEDLRLEREFHAGLTTSEIAEALGRKEGAIESRLKKLKLI